MFEGPTMVKIWKDPSKLTTTTTTKATIEENRHDCFLDVRQKQFEGDQSVRFCDRLP